MKRLRFKEMFPELNDNQLKMLERWLMELTAVDKKPLPKTVRQRILEEFE